MSKICKNLSRLPLANNRIWPTIKKSNDNTSESCASILNNSRTSLLTSYTKMFPKSIFKLLSYFVFTLKNQKRFVTQLHTTFWFVPSNYVNFRNVMNSYLDKMKLFRPNADTISEINKYLPIRSPDAKYLQSGLNFAYRKPLLLS